MTWHENDISLNLYVYAKTILYHTYYINYSNYFQNHHFYVGSLTCSLYVNMHVHRLELWTFFFYFSVAHLPVKRGRRRRFNHARQNQKYRNNWGFRYPCYVATATQNLKYFRNSNLCTCSHIMDKKRKFYIYHHSYRLEARFLYMGVLEFFV